MISVNESVVGDNNLVFDSLCYIFIFFVFDYLFNKICLTLPKSMAGDREAVFGVVIVLVFAAVKQKPPDVAEPKAVIGIAEMSWCIVCKVLGKITS